MVLENGNGGRAVFMSSGVPGADATECQKNYGLGRGPRQVDLNDGYWFNKIKKKNNDAKIWGVVRINADISGKWKFSFRCQGTSSDFVIHSLDFPTNIDNSFEFEKPYLDSDGSTNPTHLTFTYDKITNNLSCVLVTSDSFIPGFLRGDSFKIKLDRDELGPIAASQDYIENGFGCIYEVRLKNLE
jgi:hypothetical protein